jgi:hypothetical protein
MFFLPFDLRVGGKKSERATCDCYIGGVDLVGLDFALADQIRSRIQRRTGISTALLNCSHLHSAPF